MRSEAWKHLKWFNINWSKGIFNNHHETGDGIASELNGVGLGSNPQSDTYESP